MMKQTWKKSRTATGQHDEDRLKLKSLPMAHHPLADAPYIPPLFHVLNKSLHYHIDSNCSLRRGLRTPGGADMSEPFDNRRRPPPFPLYKQLSWSPDADREEAWLRRKTQSKMRRSKSVTDDDLQELKACVELGFGFNSPEVDPKLCETFPALSFYHAVNTRYNHTLSNSSPSLCSSPVSDSVSPSAQTSPAAIISHGENPQTVKARLKQWAQVVACSVRQY